MDRNETRNFARRILDSVFGYDYFISYRWSDGRQYAVELVRALEARGFDVFLDSDDFAKGGRWKIAVQWKLRCTGELIVVGTEGALVSQEDESPVEGELRVFSKTGRRINAISFAPRKSDGTLDHATSTIEQARPHSRVTNYFPPDLLLIQEDIENLSHGPSADTVNELANSFQLVRQEKWRLRILYVISGILLTLAGAATYLGVQSYLALRENVRLYGDNQQLEESRDALKTEIDTSQARLDALGLISESEEVRTTTPLASLRFAVDAVELTQSRDLDMPAAETTLRGALSMLDGKNIDGTLIAADGAGIALLTETESDIHFWSTDEYASSNSIRIPRSASDVQFEYPWVSLQTDSKERIVWNVTRDSSQPEMVAGNIGTLLPNGYLVINRGRQYSLIDLNDSQSVCSEFTQFRASQNRRYLLTSNEDSFEVFDTTSSKSFQLPITEKKTDSTASNAIPVAISNYGNRMLFAMPERLQWILVEMDSVSGESKQFQLTMPQKENPEGEEAIAVSSPFSVGPRWDMADFTADGNWIVALVTDPTVGTGLLEQSRKVICWNANKPDEDPNDVHTHDSAITKLRVAGNIAISWDANELMATSPEDRRRTFRRSIRGARRPIAINGDGTLVAVAIDDSGVRVWNTFHSQERVFRGINGSPRHLAFSDDSKWLACGGDSTTKLWSLSTVTSGVEPKIVFTGQTWTKVALSENGRAFVGGNPTADTNDTISTLELHTSATGLKKLDEKYHDLALLKVSPDGNWLVCGSSSMTDALLVSTADLGSVRINVEKIGAPFTDAYFSSDSKLMILHSAHVDTSIVVALDKNTQGSIVDRMGQPHAIEHNDLEPECIFAGRPLILGYGESILNHDGNNEARRLQPAQQVNEVIEELGGWSLRATSRKNRCAIFAKDGAWRLFDLTNATFRTGSLPKDIGQCEEFCVSQSGKLIASRLPKSKQWSLWRFDGTEARRLSTPAPPVGDWSFAASKDCGLSWAPEGPLYAWEFNATGVAERHLLRSAPSAVEHAFVPARSETLIVGVRHGTIYTYDLNKLTNPAVRIGSHTGGILSMDTESVSSRLASVGRDGQLKIWQLKSFGSNKTERLAPLMSKAKDQLRMSKTPPLPK